MLSKLPALGLALVAGLVLTGTARADDDVLHLNQPSASADVLTLEDVVPNPNSDTHDAYWGGYRGFYGGYRGFYGRGFGFGYRSFGFGGFGYRSFGFSGFGYRPFYGGFGYRSFYGYRPFYGGFGYRPFYGGYHGWNKGFFRISDTSDLNATADTLAVCYPLDKVYAPRTRMIVIMPYRGYNGFDQQQQFQQPLQQQQPQQPQILPQPNPVMPRADESYEYDGGPKDPVPMPDVRRDAPQKPTLIPYDKLFPGEQLVSVKPQDRAAPSTQAQPTGKWKFPAYGEKATRSAR